MQSNPQVLVNLKSGDRVLYDVDDYDKYKGVCSQLRQGYDWVEIGENSCVRSEMIASVYYLPEGYAKNKSNSVGKE